MGPLDITTLSLLHHWVRCEQHLMRPDINVEKVHFYPKPRHVTFGDACVFCLALARGKGVGPFHNEYRRE